MSAPSFDRLAFLRFAPSRRTLGTVGWPLLLASVLLVAFLGGCQKKTPRARGTRGTASGANSSQELTQALELLQQLDQVSMERATADLAYFLNRWYDPQPKDADWKPDALAERLPRQLRDLYPLEELARRNFDLHDTRMLFEARWTRDISDWASRQTPPKSLADWLAARQPALSREDAEQLVIAERLFDWTVRNIQLEPLLPYVAEAVGTPAAAGANAPPQAANLPPYLRGIPGPGYTREAWQTLMLGHGDAWERARVFGLLARQQNLDAVVLAVFDVKASPRPEVWSVGVLIGDQLFLFDPALGLPIPGPEGQGIATLAEVRANGALLSALHVDDLVYPVQASDLEHLVVLIDAAPASISQRMQLLEKQLAGEHRMVLTVNPGGLAERVRKSPGVGNVNLWTTPWEAELFSAAVERIAKEDPPLAIRQRLSELSLFSEISPLVQGRFQQFRGVFANDDDVTGAKGHYLKTRLPDEVLDNLANDEGAQRAMGLVRDKFESDNAWRNKLMFVQAYSKTAKFTGSYWLGLVHYESGQYDVAADWFQVRTLDVAGPTPWKPGARYNLARCYENLGKITAAKTLLLDDDSPQKHGNALRARYLK
ncbi:MAG: CDC27 family protein [Pirellulales bacterium]